MPRMPISSESRRPRPGGPATLRALVVAALGLLLCSGGPAPGEAWLRALVPAASAAALCGIDGVFGPAASGPAAAAYNPALLGTAPPAEVPTEAPSARQVELFSVAAGVGNSSLTMRQYAALNGAFWDEGDKDEILDSIEDGQLDVRGDAQARVAGVSWGRWAFGTRTRAQGRIAVPRQVLELMLYGNTVGESFSVEGASGEGIALTEYRLCGALELSELVGREGLLGGWLGGWLGTGLDGRGGESVQPWQVGLTFKLLQGWQYARILDAEGGITTTNEVLYGDGSVRSLTARGGRGWGADLGCAGPVGEAWTVSLVVSDLVGRLTFTGQVEERLDTFDVSGLTIGDEGEAVITSETVAVELREWQVDLPARFSLGLAHHGEAALASVRIDVATEDRLGASRVPRLGAGYARRLQDWLIVRGVFSVGGLDGASLGGELGWSVGPVQWNVGLRSWGSLNPWNSRGLGVVTALNLTL